MASARNNLKFDAFRVTFAPACSACADAGHIGSDAAGTWDWCPARCAAAHALHAAMVAQVEGARLAPAIAPAAQVEASGLAPVIAGPARKVAPAVVRRQSSQVPGLVLERRGAVLTFRAGPGFITYDVSAGQLRVLEAMDGGYFRPTERRHIAATARAYALKIA